MGNYSSIISLTAPISGEEVRTDITVVRFDTCLILKQEKRVFYDELLFNL